MKLRSEKYWNKRYKEGRIGWDLGGPSTPLKAYLDQIDDKDIRLLIPAGGSNYDAEYAHQIGIQDVHVVDVSPIALDLFAERCPDFPKDNIHVGNFFSHEEKYDLILEQTFFCAIDYSLRPEYAKKMHSLLNEGGTLAGLWFDFPFTKATDNPPLGGSLDEYLGYFEPYFEIKTFERCYNSAEEKREGKELFGIMKKK